MTLRVLHIIKGLGPGGAEQLLLNQARATDASDVEFHVAFLVPWKNHLVDPLEAAGWQTHDLNAEHPADLRWIPRLRRLIVDHKIDVVHGHSPLVAGWTRLALRSFGRSRPASIYTEHNEWGRHRPTTRRLNQTTIRLEDMVIAVSDGVRDSMQVAATPDVVIHGIDIDTVAGQAQHRDQVRAELGIADDEFVIGTVANLRREKAYENLLEAAALVVERNPRVRFVSVGQGPLEHEIATQHEQLGLGDRFLLLGYREDARRVMSAFDAFTLSSLHEGLPVSLMEAMALRLPVVSTDVGGIRTATEDWPRHLVAAGDVSALAEAQLAISATTIDPAQFDAGHRRFDARTSSAELLRRYRALAS